MGTLAAVISMIRDPGVGWQRAPTVSDPSCPLRAQLWPSRRGSYRRVSCRCFNGAQLNDTGLSSSETPRSTRQGGVLWQGRCMVLHPSSSETPTADGEISIVGWSQVFQCRPTYSTSVSGSSRRWLVSALLVGYQRDRAGLGWSAIRGINGTTATAA